MSDGRRFRCRPAQNVVVLTLCGLIAALRTGERWRAAESLYDRQYAPRQRYEPYHLSPSSQIAFAAVPLHAPLPILHVLARASPVRPRHPLPVPPTYEPDLQAYASAYTEDYTAFNSPYAHRPAPSEEDEEAQAVVIYARPNKNGGYSYSKRPAASTPRPKREPIVFRIHKYKITKE
ncbi:unnamed protein product [Pieris macdunnoughi]|uniref:Uncharacterized protein n=1 Tax=Pieris macdunnoughi TaxID=345717 RepID=A0A821SNE1_9NEOP|nr:unnamed protein product [Pieris macdunnoughi]